MVERQSNISIHQCNITLFVVFDGLYEFALETLYDLFYKKIEGICTGSANLVTKITCAFASLYIACQCSRWRDVRSIENFGCICRNGWLK